MWGCHELVLHHCELNGAYQSAVNIPLIVWGETDTIPEGFLALLRIGFENQSGLTDSPFIGISENFVRFLMKP